LLAKHFIAVLIPNFIWMKKKLFPQ